jgi:hypothetical protein
MEMNAISEGKENNLERLGNYKNRMESHEIFKNFQ